MNTTKKNITLEALDSALINRVFSRALAFSQEDFDSTFKEYFRNIEELEVLSRSISVDEFNEKVRELHTNFKRVLNSTLNSFFKDSKFEVKCLAGERFEDLAFCKAVDMTSKILNSSDLSNLLDMIDIYNEKAEVKAVPVKVIKMSAVIFTYLAFISLNNSLFNGKIITSPKLIEDEAKNKKYYIFLIDRLANIFDRAPSFLAEQLYNIFIQLKDEEEN